MKIKGIAFDLEGTVIDVEYAHHSGHIAAAAQVGVLLDLDTALFKIPHFIGGPDDVIVQEIWELSDKSKPVEFIAECDRFHYERLLLEMRIAPRPGFLDVLHDIQSRGIKISIGSLTAQVDVMKLLESAGLDIYFGRDITVLREDVQNVKPAPDVFIETARRMGIDPREQLVFEDSPRGIMAARAAGSRAIGMPVYNKEEVIDELKRAGAMEVFLNWNEVKNSEIIIHI